MRRLLLCCLVLTLALPVLAREDAATRSGNDVLFVDGAGSVFFQAVLDDRALPGGTYVVRLQSGMTTESLRVQLVR